MFENQVFQFQGGFAPLTRGSAPGPRWGLCLQTPVMGSRCRVRHGAVSPRYGGLEPPLPSGCLWMEVGARSGCIYLRPKNSSAMVRVHDQTNADHATQKAPDRYDRQALQAL